MRQEQKSFLFYCRNIRQNMWVRAFLLILSTLDSRVRHKMFNKCSVRSTKLESTFFSLLFFTMNSFFVPCLVIVTIPRICSEMS